MLLSALLTERQECRSVVTWFLVFFADFVVTFVMLLPSRSFWYSGLLFNSLAVLALASHLRTMLTDPVRKLRVSDQLPEAGRLKGT